MPDSPKERPPVRLAELPDHTRRTIEAELLQIKADNLEGAALQRCYCKGLRKIAETLYPNLSGLEESAINDLVEMTFEAANVVTLRQPNLLTRGFMDINDRLRMTSHPLDRPMPPERPHEYFQDVSEAQSAIRHRMETFGGVDGGTRDAFRNYLQAEIDRLRADILKHAAAASEGNDNRNRRVGYRDEVRHWMKLNTVKTIPLAAERLGVGYDILKSIMSNKGKKRYGDATLKEVLEKIRKPVP